MSTPAPAFERSPLTTSASTAPFPKVGGASGTVTPQDVTGASLEFEARTCARCGGTGRLGHFGHVMRGMCFKCNGAGGLFTTRGRAALGRFNVLCDKVLPTLREDIRVGDVVWYSYRALGAWCPVTGTKTHDLTDHREQAGCGDGEPYITFTIGLDHPAGNVWVGERTGRGYTIPRWDAPRLAQIINEVATMPGAALHLARV
jgi:hypothetical protein